VGKPLVNRGVNVVPLRDDGIGLFRGFYLVHVEHGVGKQLPELGFIRTHKIISPPKICISIRSRTRRGSGFDYEKRFHTSRLAARPFIFLGASAVAHANFRIFAAKALTFPAASGILESHVRGRSP
jgi:hypothetical protein